jgi:hypothetical protein
MSPRYQKNTVKTRNTLLTLATFALVSLAVAVPASARHAHKHAKRSSSAKTEFRHTNPCPATGKTTGKCPGYVIDHVQALKSGGADTAANMQWQTRAAAKAKDRVE